MYQTMIMRARKTWRRTAYLKGWDAALTDGVCPYSREDFLYVWNRGYRDCKANKPLPWWAQWPFPMAEVPQSWIHRVS